MKNRILFTLIITVLINATQLFASDCDADFEIAAQELTVYGWDVTFTNLSEADAGVGSVIWDFGDGSTSTAFAPVHTYAVAGEYEICLIITSSDGACVDDRCDSWMVGEADGDCEADWDRDESGLTVSFTDNSDGGGSSIITYLWDFGDGTTSDEMNPEHTYASSGTYEVCLSIITASGCYSSKCEEIDVEGGGGGGTCSAFFDINSITPSGTGFNVIFNNMSSGGISGGSTPYVWSFGDGSPYYSGDAAEHVYAAPGTYLVCLTMGESGTDCFDQYCNEIILGNDDCIDSTLINETVDCGTTIAPVCGCDNVTYDNACIAENYFGVLFWADGACSTTAIEEEIITSVHVFPNPANTVISIQKNDAYKANVYLRSMMGKVVMQMQNTDITSNTILNIEYIPSGTYLLTVENNGEIFSQPIIIQH